jgi:hypothetical protein
MKNNGINIIEFAKQTTVNLLNSAGESRRTTAEQVASKMNAILEGNSQVTPVFIQELVRTGSLNVDGVHEVQLVRGRYGGIREKDIEGNKASTKDTSSSKDNSTVNANAAAVAAPATAAIVSAAALAKVADVKDTEDLLSKVTNKRVTKILKKIAAQQIQLQKIVAQEEQPILESKQKKSAKQLKEEARARAAHAREVRRAKYIERIAQAPQAQQQASA